MVVVQQCEHARSDNPMVPAACYSVRFFRRREKAFSHHMSAKMQNVLTSSLPIIALPQIGTCWGVIRAGLNWTAKS